MSNSPEITDDCVAIAFYGIVSDSASLASLYSDVIEWFNLVGCLPDKLAVKAPGFSGNPVGFARSHSRLCKRGFSEIKSLYVAALLPDAEIPVVDWWATVSIRLDYEPSFVLEARSSVTTLDDDRLKRLVESCVSLLNPVYGIGYHREHDKGPGFYAIGLNYVTMDNLTGDDDAEAISRWGDVGMANEVYMSWFSVNWNFGWFELVRVGRLPVEGIAASCREGLSL